GDEQNACHWIAQAGRQESSLSPSADIEQRKPALDRERLARPSTRQRAREPKSPMSTLCCRRRRNESSCDGLLRPKRSGPTAPTASAGWARRTCCSSLRHIAIDNAAPADPVALFAGVLKKAKEGSTVGDRTHTVFSQRARIPSEASTPAGCCASWRGQCFHGLVHPADFGSLLACR
uniref:Integron gene cassette protein n=1 Tax=Macrostomum lignano TaxID=282301 RepID=A0A1I8FCK0_9PLAT